MSGFRVQRAGGLIRQQQGGAGRERTSNAHTLLLTTRKLVRVMTCTVGKTHELKHFQGAFAAVLLRPAGNLQRELDVTEHGAGVHQVELLEDHTDVGACFTQFGVALTGNLEATDGQGAAGGGFQAVDEADQGRLTGAGVADDCKDFTAVNGEGDVVDSNYCLGAVAEDLGDSVQNHHGRGAVAEALCQFTHKYVSVNVVVGALKGLNAVTQRTVSLHPHRVLRLTAFAYA
ncbi:Uncharacterised protein [Mycobacterium tuberculosis]|nr:Uncharacterised protein [Mycobacterium tuberculosis]